MSFHTATMVHQSEVRIARTRYPDGVASPVTSLGAKARAVVPTGLAAGGLFSFVKGLRGHARSVFRMSEKSSANACEEEKQVRNGSQRGATWKV